METRNGPNDSDVSGAQLVGRFVLLLLCVFLFLALCPVLSFHRDEVEMVRGGLPLDPLFRKNLFGTLGVTVAWGLLLTFGLAVYPALLFLFIAALRRSFWRTGVIRAEWAYYVSFPLFCFGVAMLLGIWPKMLPELTTLLNLHDMPGGVVGLSLCGEKGLLTYLLNDTGSGILAGLFICVSLLIVWYYDWRGAFGEKLERMMEGGDITAPPREEPSFPPPQNTTVSRPAEEQLEIPFPTNVPPGDLPVPEDCSASNFQLPPLSLLEEDRNRSVSGADAQEIEENKRRLQYTLDQFNVPAHVRDVVSGPQVTMYKIQTEPGLRLNSLTRLEREFTAQLEVKSLVIQAPIPGESMVGIQIPNRHCAKVSVRSLMEDETWRNAREDIPLLLGRNILGKSLLLDLAKAPHLLVAGTTNSGKSVCMNLLIMSLLFRFRPDQLRLIMVDPKFVEFAPYANLPHLLMPVINSAEQVSLALRWAIQEMNHRLSLFQRVLAKNLKEYNSHPAGQNSSVLDDAGTPLPDRMPYIVIFIDELADLMLNAKKEIDPCISNLAAKSRATGIHLVLATQRPDVKVITGTIKANFPSRIALKCATQTDSMTVLGTKGAEVLLGNGDLLLMAPAVSNVQERMQGGWVSTEEIKHVVAYLASQARQELRDLQAVKVDDGTEGGNASHGAGGNDLDDPEEQLIQEAIDIILRDKQPSISYIQRRLNIGYNRAAGIMEELEERGVVGPMPSSGKRKILIQSKEELM